MTMEESSGSVINMPEEKKLTKEELLKKAEKPSQDAMILHPFYQGKIQMVPKCPVRSLSDFSIWYTPGVAAPCRAIHKNKADVYKYTNKGNTVAVVSDGTRVLGLGDIGPEAGLPVMEGKALIFKYLGGVDAVPIVVDTKDPDELIRTVRLLQPSFGGINLEDISKPKCYKVLDELRKQMDIPVWHDDAQGTATVILAGVFGALKVVNKKIEEAVFTLLGAGSANTRTAYLLIAAGADPGNIRMVDRKGIIYKGREDIVKNKDYDPYKYDLSLKTNKDQMTGTLEDAMKGADFIISASTPEPGTIKKEWIGLMNKDPVVFACANPLPEIWPWDAKEGGARIVGTGRGDFPNQVNNSLGFPGIFRGALDVQAKTITDEMCIAAAKALVKVAEMHGLSENYVLPNMEQWEVYPEEAVAVGMMAIEQGIARVEMEEKDLRKIAEDRIRHARSMTQSLMENKFIPPPPEL